MLNKIDINIVILTMPYYVMKSKFCTLILVYYKVAIGVDLATLSPPGRQRARE